MLAVGLRVRRGCADGPILACDVLDLRPVVADLPPGEPIALRGGEVVVLEVETATAPPGPLTVAAYRADGLRRPARPDVRAWRDGEFLAYQLRAGGDARQVEGHVLELLDAGGEVLARTWGTSSNAAFGREETWIAARVDLLARHPGATRVRGFLFGRRGLPGPPATAPIADLPWRELGEACSSLALTDRCAEGLVCASPYDAVCADPSLPRVDEARATVAPSGEAFGLWLAGRADGRPTGVEVWADGQSVTLEVDDGDGDRVAFDGERFELAVSRRDRLLAGAREVRVAVRDSWRTWSPPAAARPSLPAPLAGGAPCDPFGALDVCPPDHACFATAGRPRACRPLAEGACAPDVPVSIPAAVGDGAWVVEGDLTGAEDHGRAEGCIESNPDAVIGRRGDVVVAFTPPETALYRLRLEPLDDRGSLALHVRPSCHADGRPPDEHLACVEAIAGQTHTTVRLEGGRAAYFFVESDQYAEPAPSAPFRLAIERVEPPRLLAARGFFDAELPAVGVRLEGAFGESPVADVELVEAAGRVAFRLEDVRLRAIEDDGERLAGRLGFRSPERLRRWPPVRLRVRLRDDAGVSETVETPLVPAEPAHAGDVCDDDRVQVRCPLEAPCILPVGWPDWSAADWGRCTAWVCPPEDEVLSFAEGRVGHEDDDGVWVESPAWVARADLLGAPPLGGGSCGGGTAGRALRFTAPRAGTYGVALGLPTASEAAPVALYATRTACPVAGRPDEVFCRVVEHASKDQPVIEVALEAGEILHLFVERLEDGVPAEVVDVVIR